MRKKKEQKQDFGYHQSNYQATEQRVKKSRMYEDLSTVCVIPTPTGMLPAKFVQYFSSLIRPMNQKFHVHFESFKEVGAAYTDALEMILNSPLKDFKYLLTVEWDNIIFQPDALMMLYEDMEQYDAASGLYFCKGIGGAPMAYGQVDGQPLNFIPFMPPDNAVTPVHGIGMGFALWKISMLKDKRLPKPLFKTAQEFIPNKGTEVYTQDLYACQKLKEIGNYKICVDTRVKIGHLSIEDNFVW
jgi:hypothetical protein